jgi:hypothetical protein
MRPVDSFLRSVRDAFRPSDESPAWLWIFAAFCVSAAITLVLVRRYRRRRTDERAFARFLVERRISGSLVDLITRLAGRAGVAPRSVATQIEIFERATALELRGQAPSPNSGDAGSYAEVRALRRALGFERLAGHFALLTTRELGDGQIVEVAGTAATVAEVNEACFVVTAPSSRSFPVGPNGSRVRVTLIHGQEARYEARCALLSRQTGESTQKVILAHDEQPTRIQLRKSVRVTVRGPVRLNPLGAAAPNANEGTAREARPDAVSDEHASTNPMANVGENGGSTSDSGATKVGSGSLVDISVGGAALDADIHVPVGSLVQLSFELDGVDYRDLLAFVLECRPRGRTTHHWRLEFRNLPQAHEHQLASSVARHSAKPLTQAT